jgi:hypothetical protein
MDTIKKVRPKTHDALTQALSLVLDFAGPLGISRQMQDELVRAQIKFVPPEGWGYVMLNPEQQRFVLKEIDSGPRPYETLRVWNACISFIAYDRNAEIFASRTEISNVANVLPQDTSTAFTRLVEIGALIRIDRGRYKINPNVGWSGPLIKRDQAAKCAPKLAYVNGQVVKRLPVRIIECATECAGSIGEVERMRWSKLAIELGAPERQDMTKWEYGNAVELWIEYVAMEMFEAGMYSITTLTDIEES